MVTDKGGELWAFEPKTDITAYELAIIFANISGHTAPLKEVYIPKSMMQEERWNLVARHFRPLTDDPVSKPESH